MPTLPPSPHLDRLLAAIARLPTSHQAEWRRDFLERYAAFGTSANRHGWAYRNAVILERYLAEPKEGADEPEDPDDEDEL
jgi:hypothetical protein